MDDVESRSGVTPSVNISEVARVAGVGTGTVSRVLNYSDNVRPSTRARVLEVIDRLGYRPSRLASGLSKGSPRTVAIVVPYLTRPSVVARVAGAIAVIEEYGYDAVVFNVETPAQRDRAIESLTARHRADGVVLVSIPLSKPQLAAFERCGVPITLVDTDSSGIPHTITNDARGGEMATEHLLALGHRRIGFIGDADVDGLGFRSSRRRLAGYQKALRARGLGVDDGLVRVGKHSALVAASLAENLLHAPDPPSAIFAASDSQAIGVLGAADRLGLSVPRNLSVVGYDDIESAALLGLTTVRQPLDESGSLGAQRLCALLRSESVRPLRQELPLELVVRSSSGALGAADGSARRRRETRPATARRTQRLTRS